jgi:putative hydrolase of the HAD superfamily
MFREENMPQIKVILFDCMETLIDMTEIPGEKEYALWAYEGSGVEQYWQSPEGFVEQFRAVRKKLDETPPYHREYDITERFKRIIKLNKEENKEKEAELVRKLLINYWERYKAKCYVSEEVKYTLANLAAKYPLGVVSNFIVKQGVEELLKEWGIDQYFKFVVTSINLGWRKPHPRIYQAAFRKAGAQSREAVFIGDDYRNDYETPRLLGMKAILYDRYGKNPRIADRFTAFAQLPEKIFRLENH